MTYKVSEVAKLFNVDKNTVTRWARTFSNYMTVTANPGKGLVRLYTLEDIRVMAYILTEGDEDKEIESIQIGLNRNEHLFHPVIEDLITSLIPTFATPPENIEESGEDGVLLGGMAIEADLLLIARSYKLAGDRLIQIALENSELRDLYNPALFNYRHSIELYLKVLTNSCERIHNLLPMYQKLINKLDEKYSIKPPKWFEEIVLAFNNFDSGGVAFRYGETKAISEVFISFNALKKKMEWLANSFEQILIKDGLNVHP